MYTFIKTSNNKQPQRNRHNVDKLQQRCSNGKLQWGMVEGT